MPREPDDLEVTRKSLLLRVKDLNNQESWQEFDKTYRRLIYHVALSAGVPHAAAEDLAQQVMIELTEKLRSFNYDPEADSFRSWLKKLVYWRVKDHLRKHQKAQQRQALTPPNQTGATSLIATIPDKSPSLETVLNRRIQEQAMSLAPERVRQRVDQAKWQVFDLYVIQEWEVERICRHLGLTQN